MKQFIYLFSGLLLLFASTPRVVAQEIGDYSQLNDEDYSKIDLPPLSVLFENAKNNPIYELADAKTAIERKLLQKEKWAFLGFFSLRGSYQYGMFGNESTYTDVAIAPYLTYSTQAQNGYTLGAGACMRTSGNVQYKLILSINWCLPPPILLLSAVTSTHSLLLTFTTP